jgi:ketosteroid isomerase-like protein
MNPIFQNNAQDLGTKQTINMHTNAQEELEIEAFLEHWMSFIEAKNVDGVASLYADEVISFDLIEPFQFRGISASKKRMQDWFDSFDGPISVDIQELTISAEKDVAFSHSLNRYRGRHKNGEQEDMWLRVTIGYQKLKNDWLIKHMHSSLPFEMSSRKVIIRGGEHPLKASLP